MNQDGKGLCMVQNSLPGGTQARTNDAGQSHLVQEVLKDRMWTDQVDTKVGCSFWSENPMVGTGLLCVHHGFPKKKLDNKLQAVYILPERRCQAKNGNHKAYSKRKGSQAMPGAIRSVEEQSWGSGICHAGQRGATHKALWAPRLPMSPRARV